MNEHEFLQRLSSAARGDGPPAVNVVDQVMGGIASARPRAVDPVLGRFAVVACVAAAVVAALAFQSWMNLEDPLATLANSINMVTL